MPSARIGDVIEYTSFIEEPRESEPWYAPAGDTFTPQASAKYRTLPAIVVGTGTNDTIDVQVFYRSSHGVSFHSGVPFNSNAQQPGTWRPRT